VLVRPRIALCRYGFDSVVVRWQAPLTPSSTGLSARLGPSLLSGESEYTIGPDGRFSSHALSKLAINGRTLPSSTIGAWFATYRQSSPRSTGSMAPPANIAALAAQLLEAVQAAQGANSPGRNRLGWSPKRGSGDDELNEVSERQGVADRGAGDKATFPPAPGSGKWVLYETLHLGAKQLEAELRSLLDTTSPPPERERYAEAFELRTTGTSDPLLRGRGPYMQLLSSARTAHSAVVLSPLLDHVFDFRLEYQGQSGPIVRAEARSGWDSGAR